MAAALFIACSAPSGNIMLNSLKDSRHFTDGSSCYCNSCYKIMLCLHWSLVHQMPDISRMVPAATATLAARSCCVCTGVSYTRCLTFPGWFQLLRQLLLQDHVVSALEPRTPDARHFPDGSSCYCNSCCKIMLCLHCSLVHQALHVPIQGSEGTRLLGLLVQSIC
jgi:hypothetical protein